MSRQERVEVQRSTPARQQAPARGIGLFVAGPANVCYCWYLVLSLLLLFSLVLLLPRRQAPFEELHCSWQALLNIGYCWFLVLLLLLLFLLVLFLLLVMVGDSKRFLGIFSVIFSDEISKRVNFIGKLRSYIHLWLSCVPNTKDNTRWALHCLWDGTNANFSDTTGHKRWVLGKYLLDTFCKKLDYYVLSGLKFKHKSF